MKARILLALIALSFMAGCSETKPYRELYIEIPDGADLLAKRVIQDAFSEIQKEFGNALWTGQALDKIEPNQIDTYTAQFGFGDRARKSSAVRFSCQMQKRNIDNRRPLPRVLKISWLRAEEARGPITYTQIANRVLGALADSGVKLVYVGATDLDFYGRTVKED